MGLGFLCFDHSRDKILQHLRASGHVAVKSIFETNMIRSTATMDELRTVIHELGPVQKTWAGLACSVRGGYSLDLISWLQFLGMELYLNLCWISTISDWFLLRHYSTLCQYYGSITCMLRPLAGTLWQWWLVNKKRLKAMVFQLKELLVSTCRLCSVRD